MKHISFGFTWLVTQLINHMYNYINHPEKTIGILGVLEDIYATLFVGIYFLIWAIQDKK